MSTNESRVLPAEFAGLEPFAASWALENEQARHEAMLRSSIDELRPFYDAMLPRVDEAVAYLNRLQLGAFPPDAQRLFDLLLTFVETSHPIELAWKTTDIPDKNDPANFTFLSPSCAK